MGFKKTLLTKTLLNSYSKSAKNIPINKIKKFAVVGLIVGIVSFLITIALVVLVIRWAWNFGNTTVQQNPTVSSVVETTKQRAGELLPTVPSKANDFISNGKIDEAKLSATYANLPEQTKQVWKNAMETNINEMIKSATPQEFEVLRQLLIDIGKL